MDGRDQIEEIKSKLDIATIVGQYVPSLKRSGRNYFGVCPFHKEKTPSFSVNSELGLFKCFGCGEGGDVIKFLEKIEGLDFPKALELAAQKAGVTLKRQSRPEDQKRKEEKERILEANHLAAEYYHYILQKHASGKAGKEYANIRKLTDAQIDKFMIGYAPEGFENLKNFLIKKGYKLDELVNWGLLVSKNGKIYDKFRKRLMFTITNHQGDIVGFSGRLIDPEGLGPKYLNSPETPVYRKSQVLFGLYQAKDAIRRNGFAVLVEGNIDLLSSHEAGVANIVAPLGTALTEEQLTLLKRYCDKVYFALDTDSAGQKALQRSLPLIEKAGMQAYVLDLGDFKDVDELIVGGGDWQAVISSPQEVVPYFMETFKQKYDLKQSLQKKEYTREILGFIATVGDRIVQSDYLKKLEGVVGIDVKLLAQELKKLLVARNSGRMNTQGIHDPVRETRNLANMIGNANVDGITDNFGGRIKEIDFLSRYLLAVIMEHKTFQAEIKNMIQIEQLPSSVYQNLFKGIWDSKFAKELSKVEQGMFADITLMQAPHFDTWEQLARELHQVLKRIRKEQLLEELEHLKMQSRENHTDGKTYVLRLKELTTELSKLKSTL